MTELDGYLLSHAERTLQRKQNLNIVDYDKYCKLFFVFMASFATILKETSVMVARMQSYYHHVWVAFTHSEISLKKS